MEKYRKFADEKNGINPFINVPKLKQRNLLLSILHIIIGYPLGFIKYSIFGMLYFFFLMLHNMKYILLIPQLTRLLEILINKIFSFFFLLLLGVFKFNYKSNTTTINNNPKKQLIIFSSQSSIIDWLVLLYKYSPKFLWIVKSQDSTQDFCIELSYLDLVRFSIGNIFRFVDTSKNLKKFNIEDLNASNPYKIPIVIFPECAKTTREATLNIRSNVLDVLYKRLIEKKDIEFYSEFSIHTNSYFCPNNTLEYIGLKCLFMTFSQMYNSIDIVVIKIMSTNFDLTVIDRSILNKFKNENYYYDSLIKENICNPDFRNNFVEFRSVDHLAFLTYYYQTSSNTKYVNKEE